MNRIIAISVLSIMLSNSVIAGQDNRNYPLRIMGVSLIVLAAGLGMTIASVEYGMELDDSKNSQSKNEKGSYHFKSKKWKDMFYAGLGLDAGSFLLFGTAIAFACLQIGYTPVDQGDCF